jgi:hypothetical protein
MGRSSKRADVGSLRAEKEVLHQKGANGLLAEYYCAWRLAECCEAIAVAVSPSAAKLREVVVDQEKKYVGELDTSQLRRAENQGEALGDYLFENLRCAPSQLGLPGQFSLAEQRLTISSTGHDTSKSHSADIELRFCRNGGGGVTNLAVSLKAYASTTTSLGSKAAVASLGRLFLGQRKPSEAALIACFGSPAKDFLKLLADFKAVAREFYQDSDEGRAFVEEYYIRKGTRRVNNRLRRKELGDYYARKRGFASEHKFAVLFAEMFAAGYAHVVKEGRWEEFVDALAFLWGMEGDILTLNAVAGEDGRVTHVENSLLSTVHGRLRRALRPGVVVELISTRESGTLRVRVVNEDEVIENLTLSIWKDATIQFKLTS